MGKFFAYKAEDDKQDDELDTTDNIKYYRTILSRAFSEEYFELTPDETSASIGTIKLHSFMFPDEQAVRKRIAEEESQYLFKWCDDDNGTAVESEGRPILNKLERVNIFKYWDEKHGKYGAPGFFDENVNSYLKHQDSQIKTLTKEPLILTSDGSKFEVKVNPEAIALYTDTVEETRSYKYKLVNENYNAVKTWVPVLCNGHAVNTAEYYPGDKQNKNLRYKEQRYRYFQRYFAGIRLKTRKGIPQKNAFLEKNKRYEKWLHDLPDEDKKSINNSADDAAKQIPNLPDLYTCYYYVSENNNIDGFLAYVNFGERRVLSGGGGYAGRADRKCEVDYRWAIVPASDTLEFALAKVLGLLIGFNDTKLVDDFNKVNNSFHETNYPFRYMGNFPGSFESPMLFRYYKQFIPTEGKKNEPKENPKAPRLPDKETKDADKSIRKWKKGPALDGEPLGSGSGVNRNAGKDMAKALNKCNFFNKAMEKYSGDINLNKLPATVFAKYVLTSDKMIAARWKTDNGLDPGSTLNANHIRTAQEWCHLYGNGDGGRETLDNLVSGSKHCNTEQLAIETGQRRVSQHGGIGVEIRGRLTWRITAEQFPNEGSAITAELDESQTKKYLNELDDAQKEVVANFFNEITVGKNNTSRKLKLKEDEEVRNGLKELANTIADEKRKYREAAAEEKTHVSKRLESLVSFQRIFLSQFYTYYPLGRRIRYRIFFDGKKCFEHLFDAQSESFDVNEGKILDYTVEYAIYKAMERGNVKIGGVPAMKFYLNAIKLKLRAQGFALTNDEYKLTTALSEVVSDEKEPKDEKETENKKRKLEEILDESEKLTISNKNVRRKVDDLKKRKAEGSPFDSRPFKKLRKAAEIVFEFEASSL